VISFLWAVWAFTHRTGKYEELFPWPMLGWGIGLAFSYFGAYTSFGGLNMAKREYDKLKNGGR